MNRFQEKVTRHLLKTLDGRTESFQAILGKSHNCDPAMLMDMLRRMEELGLVRPAGESGVMEYSLTQRGRTLRCTSRSSPESVRIRPSEIGRHEIVGSSSFEGLVDAILNSLPEPTPVYSQWWFLRDTYAKMTDFLLRLSKTSSKVAFVGASTLGTVFSHCTRSRVSIIDVDEVLLDKISTHVKGQTELVHQDVSQSLDDSLKDAFDVVLADPPWSSSALKTFLIRSSMMLGCGGTLVISLPPILTRPSAQAERISLLKLADMLGLALQIALPAYTEYSVPTFEYEAYRRQGIELSQSWRKGDVFVFAKRSIAGEGVDVPVEQNPTWDQYDCGDVRLFLKRNGSLDEGRVSITPVSGQDGLAYESTSSRTLPWKQASLVSTRNQIARVSGQRDLGILLQEIRARRIHVGNGLEYRKDLSPETRATVSQLLNSQHRSKNQREGIKWDRQRERNSQEFWRNSKHETSNHTD